MILKVNKINKFSSLFKKKSCPKEVEYKMSKIDKKVKWGANGLAAFVALSPLLITGLSVVTVVSIIAASGIGRGIAFPIAYNTIIKKAIRSKLINDSKEDKIAKLDEDTFKTLPAVMEKSKSSGAKKQDGLEVSNPVLTPQTTPVVSSAVSDESEPTIPSGMTNSPIEESVSSPPEVINEAITMPVTDTTKESTKELGDFNEELGLLHQELISARMEFLSESMDKGRGV